MDRASIIKQRAIEIGFDLVGVASPSALDDLKTLANWLDKGYGGEMHYLANPKRDDPRKVLPSVRSIVCVGLIYNAPFAYSTEVAKSGPQPHAWISRYAWGKDYHRTMRSKLEQLRASIEKLAPRVETRVFVDTGPIVERAFARLSGIGWMGKNTCLINEQKGSWFFLGVILTNLELQLDLPAPDRCGSCTRCLEACPTGALVEPYVMDASRCIAYFNIELKGAIPEEFRPAIGANVFGCDICQDVCPWNNRPLFVDSDPSADDSQGPHAVVRHRQNRTATTTTPEFQPIQISAKPSEKFSESAREADIEASPSNHEAFSLFNPTIEALTSISEEDFQRTFARSPVKRAKYRGWLRNLCVVMGNSGDRRFIPWLKGARENPDSLVREHASWALDRLGSEE